MISCNFVVYIAIYVAAGTFMLVKGGDRWDQQPHSTGCKLCFEIILKFNKKTYFRPHPPEEENSSNHLSTLDEVVSTRLHPPLLVFLNSLTVPLPHGFWTFTVNSEMKLVKEDGN